MSKFANNPTLTSDKKEGMIKKWVHQPLTIEHYGIHAKIQENGKVLITSAGTPVKGSKENEIEYDEVEIPASLVFKLANLLKDTRSIQYVPDGKISASVNE